MVASWSSVVGSTWKACRERRRHSKIKLLGHSFGTHYLSSYASSMAQGWSLFYQKVPIQKWKKNTNLLWHNGVPVASMAVTWGLLCLVWRLKNRIRSGLELISWPACIPHAATKLRFPMLTGKNKQLVKTAVGCALRVLLSFWRSCLSGFRAMQRLDWCHLGTTIPALLRNPLSTHLTQQNVLLKACSMSTWLDLARTGLGVVLSIFQGVSNTNCRHRIMEFLERMFHVCDFNGTTLNFPDATDATKTYPIGTWSASDTLKTLKFICPRFGQWIQKWYLVTNSWSTLKRDFSPLIPAWNALQAWSLDWFLPKAVLVQILQTCTRWAPIPRKKNWGFNPYKWPYKWVTWVIASRSGVISPYLYLEVEPFL